MLEKVLIKEFILHCWGDWKDIVTKIEKKSKFAIYIEALF